MAEKEEATLSSVPARLSLALSSDEEAGNTGLHPSISVIIPTCNSAYNIHRTIESVLAQRYPDFEILVIDAESTDRTLAIVNRFDPGKVRVYSVTEHEIFDMLNRGIAVASGLYVTFLYPGDLYLSQRAFLQISNVARDEGIPDLVYAGALSRQGGGAPSVQLQPLSCDLLSRGVAPTNLRACWFRLDTLLSLRKFDSTYYLRGGFNLLCQFCRQNGLRHSNLENILVETQEPVETNIGLAKQARETVQILRRNFGLWAAIRWVVGQRHVHLLRLWLKELRRALLGGRGG